MAPVSSRPQQTHAASSATVPACLAFQRVFFAVCIVVAPLLAIVYGTLNPTPMHTTVGAAAFAANDAANATANQVHLALGVLLSFLLPLAFVGMAWPALRRAPWLATCAGLLGLVGWIPWSALIGQEALTATMAQMGGGPTLAAAWERYNGSPVLTAYLLSYVIGHLVGAVVLGIALGRARVVAGWVAWAIALTSVLQVASFIVHQYILLPASLVLWFVAGIFIAWAVLRGADDQEASANV